jgi:hypothetical protein
MHTTAQDCRLSARTLGCTLAEVLNDQMTQHSLDAPRIRGFAFEPEEWFEIFQSSDDNPALRNAADSEMAGMIRRKEKIEPHLLRTIGFHVGSATQTWQALSKLEKPAKIKKQKVRASKKRSHKKRASRPRKISRRKR